MKILSAFFIKNAAKICALAIGVTAIAGQACRAQWYEPEMPEGLEEFLASKH